MKTNISNTKGTVKKKISGPKSTFLHAFSCGPMKFFFFWSFIF